MFVLVYTVANNASFPFKPPTLSAYKTLENKNKEERGKHIFITLLWPAASVSYKLHQLRSLAWIRVESLTQQNERVRKRSLTEDDYGKSQSEPISGAHTSCCQSAEECGDGEETELLVFILLEGGVVRLTAGAAGDRAAQRDWLHALWKLSPGAEE